jgi:adenylate cyclase
MMHFTPKFRRNLLRIIPFGLIWLIIGWVSLWTEYAVLSTIDQQEIPEIPISITPEIILFASISVFLVGCFVGFLEVTLINRYFIKSSFPKKILGKFLIYALLMFVIIFIFYMLAASIEMNQSVFSETVFDRYVNFLFSITHVSTNVQLLFSLVVSLLYAEISDNLGQNVLLNFFTGKYHKPIVEDRVFMFTDMKDSTTIAEKFGHVKYFDYLRSYYDDLSDAIIKYHGEVYQYIGDEIVISWNSRKKNAIKNSIECFFAMKEDLATKKDWYLETYGVFPDFKGALHLGEVTTGEIGALKKEIFFTGDVLNTTARMQGLCKEYGVDILVSGKMINTLDESDSFVSKVIGEVVLKGRMERIQLYTISPSA